MAIMKVILLPFLTPMVNCNGNRNTFLKKLMSLTLMATRFLPIQLPKMLNLTVQVVFTLQEPSTIQVCRQLEQSNMITMEKNNGLMCFVPVLTITTLPTGII